MEAMYPESEFQIGTVDFGNGGSAMFRHKRHRREKLTDSRDFRASVISEILSLTNSLPFSLYENLSRVRQARNDWLHGLKPLSRETAVLSVSVAERMLNLVDGLNLRVPLISRVHE
jgi:hypothetical protein